MGKTKPTGEQTPHSEETIQKTEKTKRGAIIATVAGTCAALVLLLCTMPTILPGARPADGETQSAASASAEGSRTAAASAQRTAKPSAAATKTAAPTPETSPAPTWQHVDFTNSVFIGSSTTDALLMYGIPEGANYISGTGKTVETVLTEPMPGGKVAAIDELAGKNYNQVFLAFGLNELGWPDDALFLLMYAQVISRVREHLPTAAIYIESVLPVGLERSQQNRFGVTQDRVNAFNAMLQQFAAEQGVHFLDVSTELKGPDGYLPAEASRDGVHLTKEWCGRWLQLIAQHTEDVLNAGTGATRPPAEQPPAQPEPEPVQDAAAAAPDVQTPATPEEAAAAQAEAPADAEAAA